MDTLKPHFPSNVPDSDHIHRTEIGGYDQVIALTQHMINQGVQNFYLTLDERGELPDPLDMQDDPTSIQGIFDATFEAPIVLVQANPANYGSVKLSMKMKTGTATLIQKHDKESNPPILEVASLNMEGVTAIVPADVTTLKLDPSTERFKEVKKRMRAGDHSIYQLLIDLASAAWGDATWDYGTWTDDDKITTTIGRKKQRGSKRPEGWKLDEPRLVEDLTREFRRRFLVFFELLLKDWITEGMLTMGYTKQYDKPTQQPTFEVHNVRYQTYPWTDKSGKGVTPGYDGHSRLNYLCYLENVGQNDAPDPNDPSVSVLTAAGQGKRHGNWTDGLDPKSDDPTAFGNFVLSNTCYMENYFLPKLEVINRLMRLEVTSVYCWIEMYPFVAKVGMGFSLDVGKDFSDAPKQLIMPEYKFKREKFVVPDWYYDLAKDWYSDWTKDIPENAVEWNWSHSYKDFNTPTSEEKSWPVTVWSWKQYYNHTRVFIVPGSNKIFVHGGVWFKNAWKAHPGWPFQPQFMTYQESVKWSAVFTMRELKDGGLYMDIDFSGVKAEYTQTDKFNKGHSSGLLYREAEKNFERTVNGLRRSLNQQDKFVMPSSGVFFFKNPMFDHNANLICQLEYKADFSDGSQPINESGISDPGIAKPALVNFQRSSEATSLVEIKKGKKENESDPDPEEEKEEDAK